MDASRKNPTYKSFSPYYVFNCWRQGWSLTLVEIQHMVFAPFRKTRVLPQAQQATHRRLRTTFEPTVSPHKPYERRLDIQTKDSVRFDNDDDMLLPVTYGIWILSRLYGCFGCILVSFIYDTVPELPASSKFAKLTYLSMIVWISGGAYGIIVTVTHTLSYLSPYLVNRVDTLAYLTIMVSHVAYMFACMMTLFYLIYKRESVHDYFVNRLARVSLPMGLQRNLVMNLFWSTFLFSVFDEPLWICNLASYTSSRYAVFQSDSGRKFRLLFMIFMSCSSITWACMNTIISCLINFLSAIQAVNMRRLIQHQTRRIWPDGLRMSPHQQAQYDMTFIDDYRVDTLLLDWSDTCCQGSEQIAATSESKPTYNMMRVRLFMLRDIARSLTESRRLIKEFEEIFGGAHILQLTMKQCLVSSILLLVTLTSRSSLNSQNDSQTDYVSSSTIGAFATLIVIVFATAEIIQFNRLNQLPDQANKLRAKLFKINLDLLGEGATTAVARANSSADDQITRELQLIWSLYDQIDRLCTQVNFRLLGDMYYSKRNIVFLFTQGLSITLLLMQVADIVLVI